MAMSFASRIAAIGLISAASVVPIFFSGLAEAAPKAITDEVTLYAGQAMVRNAPGPIERIAVGDGKVLAVKIVGTQELVMIGEKAGDTSMQLWMSDGTQRSIAVHVTASDSEQLSEAVRQMLGDNPNITVTPVNGNVIISGSNVSAGEVANIETIRKMYPQVLNFTSTDPVEMRPTVLMQARIMEFDKKAMTDIGIKWDNQIDGPTAGFVHEWVTNPYYRVIPAPTPGTPIGTVLPPTSIPGTAAYLGLISSISSRINLAMQTGNAWELAAPQLSARSGGTADFLVGGQVPIPTSTAFGQITVEYKDYGIKLHVEPLVNAEGNISAKIETEISKIDPSVVIQGFPGFLTRRGNTDLNVHEGDTIVISGLVDSNAAKTIDKVPGVGQIPILGELFKSRAFQANRTDLVIFVTPYVIDPNSKRNQDLIKHSDDLRQDFIKNAGADIVN